MRTLLLITLLTTAPVSAQTIISNHPPLSPEEAVAVLRGSHSIADYTDYRSPGSGPTIVVMDGSTTPWDWPAGAFAPPRPLSNDGDWYAPNYGGLYGANFRPHYGRSTYRSRLPLAARSQVTRPTRTAVPPARSTGRAGRGR